MLLYLEAGLGLLFLLFSFGSPLAPIFIVAFAAGAYGMANEKRWGYKVAAIAAGIRLALLVFYVIGLRGAVGFAMLPTGGVIEFIFAIALVALLVHEQSREYQRIWFS